MNTYFSEIAEDALQRFRWHFIECREEADCLWLTLNHAERHNALNPVMLNELAYALAYAQNNRRLRFVMLTARGPVFCAGADLKAMMGGIEHHSTVPPAQRPLVVHELFEQFTKPLITGITGNVLAGGMLLVTASTFVVAHRQVHFSLPEVKRGLFPLQVMKALAGFMPARQALNWCLLGEARPAEALLPYGLVTHLVAQAAEVEPTMRQLVEQLREGAPLAMQAGIDAYHHLEQLSHEALNHKLMQLLQTKDAQEGIRAFSEKRKPQWIGE
ncbi:enoyl-CoA hydratase/carnithine racemase [Thermonema lapsum]|uniref:Enoyl-CoA hydratase/carnithine racemase n=1 Tax=Thermonema lapsum TaxID=28195 RepID=A0A846MTJ4_9BACT|nr:enoyl-CoA hydratase-related protein [Thermonema lapsum]NIK74769.1 enoyl-CoA hydratase/carnithine racemase [Thermonema lapsum]